MSTSSPSAYCILDLPDEVLVKIIRNFNPRKRLALANSCKKFDHLIFQDPKLMENLDFSKNGRLVTTSDITRYFSDEETCKLVCRVNIENVLCMKTGHMLNDWLGRAINLVDLNIRGTKFDDIEQLGNLLEPLVQLKRLSVDLPKFTEDDNKGVSVGHQVLQMSFQRLEFLSIKVCHCFRLFRTVLQLCDELVELRVVAAYYRIWPRHTCNTGIEPWTSEPKLLRNLKIVQVYGYWEVDDLKKEVMNVTTDTEEWTDFQIIDMIDISDQTGFYLEKKLEVCEELRKTELMKSIPYPHQRINDHFGWYLVPESLLREAIGITHTNAPKTFCCLSPHHLYRDKRPCILKIDDARQLLKDPGHRITFLHLDHKIEPDCDAHLLVSAFPDLTELVLSNVLEKDVFTSSAEIHTQRRLKRRDSVVPEEQDDPLKQKTSFEMLVENTPKVRDLTMYGDYSKKEYQKLDLDALYLIARWENLTTLRLSSVHVKDGQFLIKIGKECSKLKTIMLDGLSNDTSPCCYTSDLMLMLDHCRNLEVFTIQEKEIVQVAELFVSLSKNTKLKVVSVTNRREATGKFCVPSIEQLLRRCPELNTFIYITTPIVKDEIYELTSSLKRIRGELNRPELQFQTHAKGYEVAVCALCAPPEKGEPCETVHMDARTSFFGPCFDGFASSH